MGSAGRQHSEKAQGPGGVRVVVYLLIPLTQKDKGVIKAYLQRKWLKLGLFSSRLVAGKAP